MLCVVCILYIYLSSVLEHSPAPYSPKQGSSTSALLILAGSFSVVGGCLVHCRVWNSSLLCPLRCHGQDDHKCPQTLPSVSGGSKLPLGSRAFPHSACHMHSCLHVSVRSCSHHPHLPPPSPSLKTRLQCFPLQKLPCLPSMRSSSQVTWFSLSCSSPVTLPSSCSFVVTPCSEVNGCPPQKRV